MDAIEVDGLQMHTMTNTITMMDAVCPMERKLSWSQADSSKPLAITDDPEKEFFAI